VKAIKPINIRDVTWWNKLPQRWYKQLDDSIGGTQWGCWLKHRKFVGSFPDYVIEFFKWRSSSSRTIAVGSAQPPTGMGTRDLPGTAVAEGWQPHRHLWADCLETYGNLDFSQPRGPLRHVRFFKRCCMHFPACKVMGSHSCRFQCSCFRETVLTIAAICRQFPLFLLRPRKC
jgi:hypothetical protein